jgi:hypothetical protein
LKKEADLLKELFNKMTMNEIAKRMKNPTLDEIDLMMYFGDVEVREKVNHRILPELVREMHVIDLIRLQHNLDVFMSDFSYSWWLVSDEIKRRKRMVGAKI